MFEYIVTDESLVDEEGSPKKEAGIYMDKIGVQFALCHPAMVDKLKEGVMGLFKIQLEEVTKDVWEENNCCFRKS